MAVSPIRMVRSIASSPWPGFNRQSGSKKTHSAAVQWAIDTARQTGIALDGRRAAALHALIHLRLGQPEIAGRWAHVYPRSLTDADRFTYVHEFEMLVFVRVLLVQARASEALALLADWLLAAEAAQRTGSVIEMRVLAGAGASPGWPICGSATRVGAGDEVGGTRRLCSPVRG